jgi:hypothetical protein
MRSKIPRYSRSKWVRFYCIVSMRASLGYHPCYDQRNCILHLKEGQQRGSRIITSACLYVRSKLSICISKSHWARKYQPCITRVLRIIYYAIKSYSFWSWISWDFGTHLWSHSLMSKLKISIEKYWKSKLNWSVLCIY